jgi:hypothetical protein
MAVCVLTTPALASGACPNEALREEQGSTFLPDCRAYELVSPAEKNGGDVIADTQRTDAAGDGGALVFSSLAGFGDAQGLGIATEYLSKRTGTPGTSGWTTHGISPVQQPGSLAGAFRQVDGNFGGFSDDLSKGWYRSYRALGDSPNVSRLSNVYLRTDLLGPGPGDFQLLSDAVTPLGFDFTKTLVVGTSTDFSHVIFGTRHALTADAVDTGQSKLYEWDNGTLRLAGILPDDACATPPCIADGSIGGQSTGQVYSPHAISADGSRIIFTDNTASGSATGDIYMRIDHATTIKLNASEKPFPDAPEANATYWNASVDGSRVFFTTTEALTDDGTSGVSNLYMYDLNAPVGARLTLLSKDTEPADGTDADTSGVIGVSDDGKAVYFIARGQLVQGQPVIGGSTDGIYLWRDDGTPGGTLSYVGGLARLDDEELDLPLNWGLGADWARVSPDGRHLLFVARDGSLLTGYDHGSTCGSFGDEPCRELYVYSAPEGMAPGRLACASCNPSGATATSEAADVANVGRGAAYGTAHLSHALSDDGSRVFFDTGEALVPEAHNKGVRDVYEYDVASGALHLLSNGHAADGSYFLDASRSGDDVFIASRERLSRWDVDGARDVYDVRVGGGVPEPVPSLAGCSGDGCQGGSGGVRAFDIPSSIGFAGAGNLRPVAETAVKPSTGARKLSRVLKACQKRRDRRQRKRCETRAKRRYAKTASTRGGGSK